jgi:hypothetical protein
MRVIYCVFVTWRIKDRFFQLSEDGINQHLLKILSTFTLYCNLDRCQLKFTYSIISECPILSVYCHLLLKQVKLCRSFIKEARNQEDGFDGRAELGINRDIETIVQNT